MARPRLSQEEVADRMQTLGHNWLRQTVGQVEKGKRNLTVDELVSLAAALQTTVAFLLSPVPLGSYEPKAWGELVDVGGPRPLIRPAAIGLYGFEPRLSPAADWHYLWPDVERFTNVGYLASRVVRLREEGKLSTPLTVENVRTALLEEFRAANPDTDPSRWGLVDAVDTEFLQRLEVTDETEREEI